MNINKVEICGVNTSKLKVISEERKKELISRIRQGDEDAREEMINGNLKLVLSVIRKFAGRGENPDDLFQVGVIGLIKAIDNFDCDKDVKFSTYGVPMIIGEVRRYLRDNNSIKVSRSIKDTAYKVMQMKEKFTSEKGREPTVSEISEELMIPAERVIMALEASVEPVSIYEPVFSDGNDTVYIMDTLSDENDDNKWLERIALRESVKSLGEREKMILGMRYLRGKTQMEVAQEMGISQAQVSRLEKSVIQKLREN